MKKIILALAALACMLPAAAQNGETYPSYIQVNGRAEREIVPDEFYLMILINERDSKGKISVESQQRDMVKALRKVGIDTEKQLRMANVSSEFFKKGSSLASAKYQLLLHTSSEVADVWQALDALGISNVSIEKVSHSEIEKMKQEVRIAAVKNAQQNAQMLAEALGQKIGPCFYIYDSNNDIVPAYYDNAVMTRAAKFAAGMAEDALEEETALDFRTIRLQYHVQTKFVLLP